MILGGMTLLYLLWLKTPSASDLGRSFAVDKGEFLKRNGLYQITDILPGGYLVIDRLNAKFGINHPRFRSLSPKRAEILKQFFVGKFVKIENASAPRFLNLPLELYHPYCFSNDPGQRIATKQCPVLLKP